MAEQDGWRKHPFVQGIGSLWLGAMLLLLLLVAMACATVYESWHGTEQAMVVFYKAWWFHGLALLLAVNVTAALLLRYPFRRAQLGFVITHASLLVVLLGAVITQWFGVDGQLALMEGETSDEYTTLEETLSLARMDGRAEATVSLDGLPGGGLEPVENPPVPALQLGEISAEVVRYLPDSSLSRRVVDTNPTPQHAVEVALADPHGSEQQRAWVFDGQTQRLGTLSVHLRRVDEDQLTQLLASDAPSPPRESIGTVRVEYEDERYEFSVEECQKGPVEIGQTGYTLRVLRYMPHAVVGPDWKLRSASNEPVNPAIEVELTGPQGTIARPAFAKFPEFWTTHGPGGRSGPKVVFVASQKSLPSAPVTILSAGEGKLYGLFRRPGQKAEVQELTVGRAYQLPWGEQKLTVLRHLERARVEEVVEPVEPVRRRRIPAVLLAVRTASDSRKVWLQKYSPQLITTSSARYRLAYGNRQIPLGFAVTLHDFRIGRYPGTMRPRSFESHIEIVNPSDGRRSSHVVSMNHPVTFGGYTFYQSSYQEQGSRMISVLSVSRDPGQPVAFAGYLGLMAGMLVVIWRRMAAGRKAPAGGDGAGQPTKAAREAREK